MSKNDIEGITVLIMVQASKDADANLKKMVLDEAVSNGTKKADYMQLVGKNEYK